MTSENLKPTILISDLHADRWDRDRKELFFSFLDYVEKNALELYVLGDIFDFPAPKNNSIWPRFKDLITRLRALPSKGVPVLYMIGNHDISLRGIEFEEAGVTMTYSDSKHPVVKIIHGKQIYMEHGHYYDPLFRDHIYDAMDFLKEVTGKSLDKQAVDFMRAMVRILQRRPKTAQEAQSAKNPLPAKTTNAQPPKHAQATRAVQPPQTDTKPQTNETEIGVPERFLKIWEQAAEQLIKRMRYDAVIFGHTHAPDIIEMTDRKHWYINTGDWATHNSYIEFTKAGISLYEWPSRSAIKKVYFLP